MGSEQEQYKVGDSVEWLYEMRGGYGYRWWVKAVVLKVNRKKITINALRTDGTEKVLSVDPGKLRRRVNK